jgi:SprT protein
MQVSLDVRARVESEITRCMDIIESHYQRAIPRPTISYEKTGTTAGTANYIHNHITFNGALLMLHIEDFMARTVPHEYAHIVCNYVYPDAYKTQRIVGTRKWTKRELHGPRFQEIMAVMGITGEDASRCHSYDTTTTAKPKSKYEYRCVTCDQLYLIASKIHNEIASGNPRRRRCQCGSAIVLKTALGKVTKWMAYQIVKGEVAPVEVIQEDLSKLKAPKEGSKLFACWELYCAYQDRYNRQGMIGVFVNEVGCTWAGASTYHATCKKLYNAGV